MNILSDNSNNIVNPLTTQTSPSTSIADLSNNILNTKNAALVGSSSSNNNDTSNQETLGQKMNDIKNFSIYLATFVGSILLYFVIGIVLLYLSKVFQTNLIPDDLGCFPYTDNEGNLDELSVNPLVNINRYFLKQNNSTQTEKLIFDYKENKDTFFLNRMIHKWTSIYKPEEKTTGLLYWIGSFIQRFYYSNMYLLAGFFGILKTISFNFDFIILLLGPIALGIFILISMILIYPVYFYSFIPQLYVISCKNISTTESPNTWLSQIGPNATFFSWLGNIFYLIFWFFLALIICIPPLAQILSLLMIFVLLFSGLATTQGEKIIDEKTREPYGFFDFFKDTIKFKSWFFMAILTVGVIQGVPLFFDKLTATVVVFVLVLLVILELMGWENNPLPLYGKIAPDYLSPEVKKNQIVEKKGCKMIPLSFEAIPKDPNKKGFFDRWTDWFIEKGFLIWSFTPTGRAATVAGTLATKAGPLLALQNKSSAFASLSNIASNVANESANNVLNNALTNTSQNNLLGQNSPVLGQTTGFDKKPATVGSPPVKPVKPVKPMGRRRGGGDSDYTKLAQTLKKILNN